jgi:hypothetical protein
MDGLTISCCFAADCSMIPWTALMARASTTPAMTKAMTMTHFYQLMIDRVFE